MPCNGYYAKKEQLKGLGVIGVEMQALDAVLSLN